MNNIYQHMTKQELKWFNNLHEDRIQVAAVMHRPEFIHVFKEAIDKYSESAHFLYELLQNADDAKATKAELILENDKLIFRHNGTVRFTVSDPSISPEEARLNGIYGHINSITSIGFSTKNERTGEGNKIGKFGVGFKSIFQYTDTPLIYDYNIDFRLDKYIVPTLLTDKKYSEKGKTVFVFPFNHPQVPVDKCYRDISSKIRSLEHPTLFLHNLKKVIWTVGDERGTLDCKVSESYKFSDILAAKIAITDGDKKSSLWKFSRNINITDDGKTSEHNISVGLFLDKGKLNVKVRPKLYCFFKTNDSLHTCFIAHAPFALANNREQLKKDNKTNYFLIKKLAELMADSLECLRDIGVQTGNIILNDNIVDILNIKDSNEYFRWREYIKRDSCLDCGDVIRNTLIDKVRQTNLLYCREGFYIDCEHSIWTPNDLLKLLTTKQLNYLIGYDEYYCEDGDEELGNRYWLKYSDEDEELVFHFVLTSKNTKDEDLITDILYDSPYPSYSYEDFGRNITNEFMKAQSNEWLEAFYKFVLKNRLAEIYQLNVSQKSSGVMRNRPIVKLENGDFVAPYENGRLNVFYKSTGVSYEANYVNDSLLKLCPGFTALLKLLDVSVPDRLDYIFTQVLPQYRNSLTGGIGNIITVPHPLQDFEEIFLCWHNSSKANAEKLLEQVNKTFGMMATDGKMYKLAYVIRPNDILVKYHMMSSSSELRLLDVDYYKPIFEKYSQKTLNEFLDSLCFQLRPSLKQIEQDIRPEQVKSRITITGHPGFTYTGKLTYRTIYGLEEYIHGGHKKHKYSSELSHYVWDLLCLYSNDLFKDNARIRYQPYCDYRYNAKYITYPNPLIELLNKYPWIHVSKNDKFVKIKELFLEDFVENGYQYDAKLMEVLQIISSPKAIEREQIQGMSPETQATFAMGEKASEYFKNKDEMVRALELLNEEKAKNAEKERRKAERQSMEELSETPRKKQKELKSSDFADVCDANPILKEERISRSKSSRKNLEETLAGFDEKAQTTRAELEEIESLREVIEQSEKYSYIWFKSLMELESRSNGSVDTNSGKKTIFLQFDEVSVDKRNENIIVLKGCGRYVPTSIEDIEGINVTFYFRTGLSQALEFEAASVKDNTIRLKVSNYKLDTVSAIKKNINLITRAEINIDKPIQLIEKWKLAIDSLGFEDNFNLRDSLRSELKFIFGPPGTGKTTELSRQITELIETNDECKILVLAPTNKACDVLTKKLLQRNADDDSWIWRFVSTMDSELDHEEVVYPRDSDIMSQDKVCVISTMARLSFDGFNDWRLSEIEWDYIIIDEASMIPLYQIVYPIFSKRNSKLIIAGDPFQIEPIVNIDEWAGENIYTLVNLNDFKNPRTVPHQFEVQKLCTQYRSIPNVGEIYSKFAYGGILQHNRLSESRRDLNFGIQCKSLNIVSFPVNRNSSLYEPKRLLLSNVHIYSILFVAEFIEFITKNLSESTKDARISIGVISPYGAEVSAIEKLCQQKLKDVNANIDIICGTAHGFQGDECDIVIVVMNPPASGMKLAKDKVFINKTNILNVAISRARDYVFMLIPDKEYQYFANMDAARRVGKLMFDTSDCQAYTCDKLESIIFGRERVIESSTFITSHQSTNVYSEGDDKYEIRVDENALDIQVND